MYILQKKNTTLIEQSNFVSHYVGSSLFIRIILTSDFSEYSNFKMFYLGTKGIIFTSIVYKPKDTKI